jgi:hypothetical protein
MATTTTAPSAAAVTTAIQTLCKSNPGALADPSMCNPPANIPAGVISANYTVYSGPGVTTGTGTQVIGGGTWANITRAKGSGAPAEYVISDKSVTAPNMLLSFKMPQISDVGAQYFIGLSPTNKAGDWKSTGGFGLHFMTKMSPEKALVGYYAVVSNGKPLTYSNPAPSGGKKATDDANYCSYANNAVFTIAYAAANTIKIYHNGSDQPPPITLTPSGPYYFFAQLSPLAIKIGDIQLAATPSQNITGYVIKFGMQAGGKRRGNKRSHKKTRKVRGGRKH